MKRPGRGKNGKCPIFNQVLPKSHAVEGMRAALPGSFTCVKVPPCRLTLFMFFMFSRCLPSLG